MFIKVLFIAFCCTFIVSFILTFISLQPADIFLYLDEPTVTYKNYEPLGELTDVAIDSEHLYALYNRKQVVKVYTLDGSYLYSIIFPGDYGTSRIVASNNNLYYITDVSMLYHYYNDKFQGVYQLEPFTSESQQQMEIQNLQVFDSSSTYYIDGLNVICYSSADKPYPIITRNAWLFLFHSNIMMRIMFSSFFLLIITASTIRNISEISLPRHK